MKRETILAGLVVGLVDLALLYLWPPPTEDIIYGAILAVWVLFIVYWGSKPVAKRWNKYISRKFIHFTTGGLVSLLIYLTWVSGDPLFKTPTVPVAASFALAFLTLSHHLEEKELEWFQVRENLGEVWFCVSWGLVFLALWYVDLPAAAVATMFMAYGDGVTGIVRNFVYKRWTKGFWGSVAMLAVSLPLGLAIKGFAGALSAIIATLIEVWPAIDDNITVPLVSAASLMAMGFVGL